MRGSKTGKCQTGGSEDPHAPPAMERERIASRRHAEVTPADKRKHLTLRRVFEARATGAQWHAKVYPHRCQMPRSRRLLRLQMLTLTALSHSTEAAHLLRRRAFERCYAATRMSITLHGFGVVLSQLRQHAIRAARQRVANASPLALRRQSRPWPQRIVALQVIVAAERQR